MAVASRREQSCRELLAPYGLNLPVFTDYDRLLNRPGVDAVILCTLNHLHADETVRAAQASKSLLIEKPVALTGERSHIDLEDAVRTHEIALAIEESVRTRRPVSLPLRP